LLGCFFDHGRSTTALLKAWRGEQAIVISRHADLEFMHEVHLMQASGLGRSACVAAAEAYQAISRDFVRRATDSLYLRAAIVGIQHALSPGPSMHLAVAMDFRDQILAQLPSLQDPVRFGTLDPCLAVAARKEGFRIVPGLAKPAP
jgi:hypothetical protein